MMELTAKVLAELQNRLKVGNRRAVHLNAIPARSRYKFDLHRLSYLDKNLPKEFLHALLNEQNLKFKISWKDNVPDLNTLFKEDQAQLIQINKAFENLINQTDAIESEKGINTFGFGFPLLVRRDQADDKLIVAPILIWSLRIKRSKEFNTWVIQRNEDDPILVNEVLINHLQNDAQVEINQLSSEILEKGFVDREGVLDVLVDLLKAVNSTVATDIRQVLSQKVNTIRPIPDKKHYEELPITSNSSLIDFGGLFSIFEVQKQNVIKDYDDLMNLEGITIDLEDLEEHTFQSLSSVETDPSQQSILHALESKRNILIQGPPGTGKSQSLTAVLVNALENHKKTIVVCEKRTALDVLHKALIERGLGSHAILIQDEIAGRRAVVNSVRDRKEKSIGNTARSKSLKESLDHCVEKTKSIVSAINKKHQKLGNQLLGGNNWPQVVGKLLAELRQNNEEHEIDIDQSLFNYNAKELNEILQVLQEGQKLYEAYKPYETLAFLNPNKFVGDHPFLIEKKLKEDFANYKFEICGENSKIKAILAANKANADLFDLEKTGSFSYKISSLFSKTKKQTLRDQQLLSKLCTNLQNQVIADNWLKEPVNKQSNKDIIESIEAVIEKFESYVSSEDDLFTIEFKWLQFYSRLSKLHASLVEVLKPKNDWRRIFLINYFNSLLTKSATIDLPMNDHEHKDFKVSFNQIRETQLQYVNEYWNAEQLKAARKFEARNQFLSVENLYNKRGSHKHQRRSLRQIVKYDIELFSTYFPVILTTPEVCSNLFKGMNKYFDIVLFDEASQLRLEDNLPALLKGKQVIVAGDEHQMPPSNYFSKIFDGAIEDEEEIEDEDDVLIDRDNLMLSCESLLDFASELNFEKRYLDFHYRSKHPFLIDFSNYAFYNRRLKPLPNNFEYTPIKYIQVDGTYSDHCNEREAEAVLSIIEHNIHRLPNGEYPSVGIGTFNIAQRNLIKSKILERQKFERYAKFNQKIVELEEKGLFIKNLENIQGDERDVIILSTTYGTGKDGKFSQRFGPINHKKGYKLLNVIVTRAKYKVYACTSVPESVFLNYKEHLNVEGANNRRAVFFAYLAYAKAVSENNHELRQAVLNALAEQVPDRSGIGSLQAELESPFEEEVYQALLENFDESKLALQVQFAGFRIDMVYDPKNEGMPKIAIECDGASYHSSREAYLYDYYRQQILERHGFIFHRIWSTNWWRNPKRETKMLVDFIREVESRQPYTFTQQENADVAFTDDLSRIKGGSGRQVQIPIQHAKVEKTATRESVVPIQPNLFTPQAEQFSVNPSPLNSVVRKNSIIKVKYLNNDRDLTIQLVEYQPPKFGVTNGIQKINIKSPLAESIIGKAVGDTVRIGNLDNYVEILEIKS